MSGTSIISKIFTSLTPAVKFLEVFFRDNFLLRHLVKNLSNEKYS